MSAKITITKSQKLSIFSVKSWILCYVFKPSQLLKEWLMNERVKYTARSQMRCSNLSNLSSFHKIRLALFHLSVWGLWKEFWTFCTMCMYIRGHQIREGGNGENWEGPQFDPVVRRVEPESLSSLGAREPLPARASKMAWFMLWF